MSINNDALIFALKNGYYINSSGNVISPLGIQRKIDYDHWGYPRFRIKFIGKVVNIYLHRIIAYKKYGEKIFEPGVQVRHKNNNKLDYSLENILIGTSSQNMMDIPKNSRIKKARLASSKLRRFTEGEVAELRKLNKHGISYNKLSKAYKVCKSTLSYIVNGKTYALNNAGG